MVTEAFNHQLTRDKVRKEIILSQREDCVGLECFALNMNEGL